ncbi:hypothetical protein VPNG_10098 [Cytospora leucostoma]|uniref:Auxin efflux carrier n=1 Tax=Cytospora leucostoma TaxID=1230097 RepID=A0A423VI32_9PEZI|nr:hypothetical protein VPNG_10098 [Cytospora leucostoma]
MAPSGILEAFLAAIQASVSVLLVISYGGIAAKLGLISPESTKAVSKVCVQVFLPALLITNFGSELHSGSGDRYAIIVVWGLICHLISFGIGIFGHLVLKMPDWVTVGVMFNNTASYPLLLIGALEETGILSSLIVAEESTKAAIERAKAYFLVFGTISSCLTFAVGPRLIDTEHAPEEDPDSDHESQHGEESPAETDGANEETGLLNGQQPQARSWNPFSNERGFFPSTRKPQSDGSTNGAALKAQARRAYVVPKRKWHGLSPRTRWWLLFISDFLNAPLIGAIIGAVIGLSPPLHRAFFNDTQDGGIFTAWLTASLKNIGGLFVPLPVVIAGVSLYTAYKGSKEKFQGKPLKLPWGTVTYIMVIRFVIWPVVSVAIVYLLASKTDFLGSDPMLWFTLMLMPCGPPAMKLITLVQVSDAEDEDEASIAKLLTIAYIISPILSFTVVASLQAAKASM